MKVKVAEASDVVLFYKGGGFSNPHTYLRMIDGSWCYFMKD